MDADRAEMLVECKRREEQIRASSPADLYEPHHTVFRDGGARPIGSPSGQRQFHESTHAIRVAAPGNGWGGTVAMGCEIDAWCRHTNRWQVTPPWPVICVWFCPEFRQFEALRSANLDPKCFGTIPNFRHGFGGPRYEWPNGSKMFLASYDRSWTHIQGIEIDLVVFDEQPPPSLYREILQRRRGQRKTRIVCKATQTQGRSWMQKDIYDPWLRFHQERGLTEVQAMDAQRHPRIWCWPMGGIHDNPAADDEDVSDYLDNPWPSPRERHVRVWGGFIDFTGDPVFHPDSIDWLRERREGLLEQADPVQGMLEIAGGGWE